MMKTYFGTHVDVPYSIKEVVENTEEKARSLTVRHDF